MPQLDPEAVLAELQPIFADVLDAPGLLVTRASSAENTRDWDSLAHICLIETVERHFGVRFALGELQDLKAVGDLVDLVVEKVGKK